MFSVVPATSKPTQKRWIMAFTAIYCSRAFSLTKPKRISSHVSSTSAVIDIPDPHPCFPNIDRSELARIVKEKNRDILEKYGGVQGLASSLKTNLEHGIEGNDGDISQRKEVFESNAYHWPPAKNLWYFVWEDLRNPSALILLFFAALSLGFGGLKDEWYNGGSMILAVFLSIAVSAGSNFRQNRQFVKLSKVSNNIEVDVVRSGRRQQILIFEIVVGDVVWLKIGDQVPADGLLIDGQQDGHSLTVDESNMIGQSDLVEVDATQNPFLFSGNKVAHGFCRMLVTAVGMNTTWGEISSRISNDSKKQTPVQSWLTKLISSLEKVCLFVAFIVLDVFLIEYFSGKTTGEDGNKEFKGSKTKVNEIINYVIGMVAYALTLVDVAIPEWLPLAVTLTLAYSMKRMMNDHAIIRKLSACETVGSVTTICTDKTGTLTLNQMEVTKFCLDPECVEERGTYFLAPIVVDLLHQGIGLNTTGTGSPTEEALLTWAVSKQKLDMKELKKNCEIVQVEVFNSTKKKSGILMRKKGGNMMNVHWKGAAEMVLALCSNYYDVSGHIKVMDDVKRKKFEQIIQGMAASSLRCIAFAHKQVAGKENERRQMHTNIEEHCLTLLGLVGLKDLCRPGVKEAVEECQYAGVNVKMITGDNIFTARAIAIECGILKPNQDNESGAVVEGEEFRNYTPEEQMEKVDEICVMARCSPFDKLLMVQCLKQKGHIVVVIGDGSNDVPALKEADIGLSMGIQRTVVAKKSSDIVILDDNFGSVARVLRWGRCAYDNIHKIIQFQLTVSVVVLVIKSVAEVSASEIPLTSGQLSWVNLIMYTLGALALVTEKPTKELTEKPPVGRTKPVITNVMWKNILAQAFYQIVVLLILQFKGESIFKVNESVNYTMIFNVFVLCQVFIEFNARKLEKKNVFEGICKSKLFLVIIGVVIVIQVVMVEFWKKFVHSEPLNWWQWGVCVGFASVSWLIGWVVKWIPVPEKPFFSYLKENLKNLRKYWQWEVVVI